MGGTQNYKQEVYCRNCGEKYVLDIPFGTLVQEFVNSKKCDRCGCFVNGSDQRQWRYNKNK